MHIFGFSTSSTILSARFVDWHDESALITKQLAHLAYPFPYCVFFMIHLLLLSSCYFSSLPFTCFINVSIIAHPRLMDRPLLIHTSPQPIFSGVFPIPHSTSFIFPLQPTNVLIFFYNLHNASPHYFYAPSTLSNLHKQW